MNRLRFFALALLVLGSLDTPSLIGQIAPRIQLASQATVGTSLDIDVVGSPGNFSALALSYERRITPLNSRFGAIWLRDPGIALWFGRLTSGATRVSLPIPTNPEFVGFKSFLQAYSLPGGASPLARFTVREPNVDPTITKNILVINYDPIIESQGSRRLHEVLNWNNPRRLTVEYADALRKVSGGFADYEVVEWIDVDEFPLKTDGFRYTDASYLQAWNTRTFHVPDLADYDRILTDHNVVARINSGQIDEVLVWGAPGFGYFESRMAGPNAYWVNSPGMPQVQSVRKFIVMGLNYERTFDFALHSYGHRVESILDHVYRPASGSDWDLFNNYHATSPGSAGVGSIHFPPNGRNNYDYENPAFVPSTAIDWKMNWPNLSGTTALVNNANWTSSHGGFMAWWMDHLPRRPGRRFGFQNNWWKYAADFNAYPESR